MVSIDRPAQAKATEAYHAYFAGDAATAAQLYRDAYELDPTPERAFDIGIALSHSGGFDEALEWLSAAYHGRPENKKYRGAYGEALFRDGQWLEAWKHWSPLVENPFEGGGEEWNGQSLEGKEVLVVPAGGFGDVFMLARYIPELGSRFHCTVSFAPTEDLVPVFLRQPSLQTVNMTQKRKWEIWLHMFHFMQLFQMTPETVVWNGPYIEPISVPRSRGLRIGIKLGAGEKGDVYKFRSVPGKIGEQFLNEISDYGVELVALTLSNEVIRDWRDTIALVSACDLVLSVDTAVLHLAGAMGKPAWAILGDFNDAKWGKAGSSTPWYPSMQIFRGEGSGYEYSLDQVTAALRVWLLHQKEN
jgi:tetratricopeptide (TPR) repeat protein